MSYEKHDYFSWQELREKYPNLDPITSHFSGIAETEKKQLVIVTLLNIHDLWIRMDNFRNNGYSFGNNKRILMVGKSGGKIKKIFDQLSKK